MLTMAAAGVKSCRPWDQLLPDTSTSSSSFLSIKNLSGYLSLKVPNVKFDFDVSVRHCQLSTHRLKLNSTLGTLFHAMIRTHHFDFDVRF